MVVEVKCAWNQNVLTDMKSQLFARYLTHTNQNFGIYVVGYFHCDTWNLESDSRKRRGKNRMKFNLLKKKLFDQAMALSSKQKSIKAFTLDARLSSASDVST
jgi:hypothetical protein